MNHKFHEPDAWCLRYIKVGQHMQSETETDSILVYCRCGSSQVTLKGQNLFISQGLCRKVWDPSKVNWNGSREVHMIVPVPWNVWFMCLQTYTWSLTHIWNLEVFQCSLKLEIQENCFRICASPSGEFSWLKSWGEHGDKPWVELEFVCERQDIQIPQMKKWHYILYR